jgi:endoglucanase
MKTLKFLLLTFVLGLFPVQSNAWPGMELPPLHVEGRYLKDPCGNTVLLHGVAMTPSPWFNGCMYGSNYCRWNNYNVQGCLNYNNAVMDKLTNTSDGWYLNYIRLHIDPYWTNNPGSSTSGEQDISQFNYSRLVTYTDQVIIPLINHARTRGMYVVLRPPGVCPQNIALYDSYYNYLVTIWDYLSQHPDLKNVDNVMFELANEPINIRASDGTYGQDAQKYYDALKNFFQPIVDLIRNNGADNVIWIPGLGYQSLYRGLSNNPISGSNIGYAVHIYPGYWGADLEHSSSAFTNAWNTHIKPVADFAPIMVTETDWSPDGEGTWGTGTTSGFGTNLKNTVDASGNVGWNLLCPEDLIDHGDPNGGTAFNNNWEACAAPVKLWFSQYAGSNLPTSNCGSGTISNGTFNIINRNSGQYLDCYNFGTTDGTNVIQWSGSGNTNQQWEITAVGDDYYRLSPVHAPNEALDVTDYSSSDGANVQLWGYWGGECQQWKFIDVGDGYYQIEARHSGQLLEVVNASTENGANVQQWPANNHVCQHWSLQQLKSASGSFDSEGIEKPASSSEIQVYPNPTNGNFTIQIPEADENEKVDISIFDLQGRLVYENSVNSQDRISINTVLGKGIYLLKINCRKSVYTHKLKVE